MPARHGQGWNRDDRVSYCRMELAPLDAWRGLHAPCRMELAPLGARRGMRAIHERRPSFSCGYGQRAPKVSVRVGSRFQLKLTIAARSPAHRRNRRDFRSAVV